MMQVSPKLAFLNVTVFVVISLLYFMARLELQQYNLSKSTKLSHRILNYVWPVHEKSDDFQQRGLLWESTVNKSLSQKREQRFPDVIIVGAERCGAEALTKLLMLHPLVKAARGLETRFFTNNFAKGSQFYKLQMPWASPDDVVMESTPSYFSWPPLAVPNRIKNLMPDAKVLIVLCNPVDRVHIDFIKEVSSNRISADYKYEIFLGTYLRKFKSEQWSTYNQWEGKVQSYIFDLFIEDHATHLITTGLYYHHLMRWKAEFDTQHLKIISREELMDKTGNIMEELQAFLGLPRLLYNEDFVYNTQSQTHCFQPTTALWDKSPDIVCPMRWEVKQRANQSHTCAEALRKFYAPFNKKLYKEIGREFSW